MTGRKTGGTQAADSPGRPLHYRPDGVCTNQAASFFSRMRRAEPVQHHHISEKYLLAYVLKTAWKEDNRRLANGRQHETVTGIALAHLVSRVSVGIGSALTSGIGVFSLFDPPGRLRWGKLDDRDPTIRPSLSCHPSCTTCALRRLFDKPSTHQCRHIPIPVVASWLHRTVRMKKSGGIQPLAVGPRS
jgi:hypothetical protein